MNAKAAAGDFPVHALLRGGTEQARIPRKRHAEAAAVHKVDAQFLGIDTHAENPYVGAIDRSAHAMPPENRAYEPESNSSARSSLYYYTRNCALKRQEKARI